MKTLVLSYSFTGNNAVLAEGIAEKTGADWVKVVEKKQRNVFTIVLDVLFNRTPKIESPDRVHEGYERLVFVAPVWLGKVASPLRAVFKHYKGQVQDYSFVSISAGADGKAPQLEPELIRRMGAKPQKVVNPLIIHLFPDEPKMSRQKLDAYRLKGSDATVMVDRVVRELQK